MKNLKTLLRLIPMVLLVLFASCGDDDSSSTDDDNNGNNSSDKIVGKWKYVGYYDGFMDEFDADADDCYDDIFTFNANGSGKFLEEDCEDGDITTTFNWENKGNNTYELSGNSESYEFMVEWESNTRLKILDDEEGSGEVYVKQ